VENPVATAIKDIKLISRREERKQTLAQKVSERVAEIEQQKLALELASRRHMDEGARLVTCRTAGTAAASSTSPHRPIGAITKIIKMIFLYPHLWGYLPYPRYVKIRSVVQQQR
jgi:hypothetical protein